MQLNSCSSSLTLSASSMSILSFFSSFVILLSSYSRRPLGWLVDGNQPKILESEASSEDGGREQNTTYLLYPLSFGCSSSSNNLFS